jgi:hypothetical protein
VRSPSAAYSAAYPRVTIGKNSGGAVDTLVARSSDGGRTWVETRVSTFSRNLNWETHGQTLVDQRIPFWGDHIYVSVVHGGVNVAWTDSRDLVSGLDPPWCASLTAT